MLLVDDDQMVRAVCSNMLQAMKHDVLAIASGTEAVRLLQGVHEPFDVMLLDDSMPEMDGLATLEKLHSLGLRIKVVIISGGNATIDRYHACCDLKPLGILTKPFSLKRLGEALSLAGHAY